MEEEEEKNILAELESVSGRRQKEREVGEAIYTDGRHICRGKLKVKIDIKYT